MSEQTMQTTGLKWLSAILLLIIIFMFIRNCNDPTPQPTSETKVLIADSSSVKYWQDELDRAHYKQDLIATEYKRVLLENEDLKQLVEENKKRLKTKGTSATTITVETLIRDTVYVEVIQSDSTTCPDSVIVTAYNEWYSFNGTIDLRTDIFTPELKIRNRLDVVIGDDRTFLDRITFKPQIMYAEVVVHNPYSELTKFKTYSKPKSKGKAWKWVGIGATFVGGVYVGSQIAK